MEIASAGWVCGFSNAGIYESSCEALESATVLAYAKSDVDNASFLEDRNRLSHQIERQVCALHNQVFSLGRKSAEERVAAFFMRFVPGRSVPDCAGPTQPADNAAIEIPMTRYDIADYLGLTHETISRTITNLERKGLVTRTQGDTRSILINSISGLCRAAHNECLRKRKSALLESGHFLRALGSTGSRQERALIFRNDDGRSPPTSKESRYRTFES